MSSTKRIAVNVGGGFVPGESAPELAPDAERSKVVVPEVLERFTVVAAATLLGPPAF